MLTASSTDNYYLTNLGPLTTTFTAPASCATPDPYLQLGPSYKDILFYSQCSGSTLPHNMAIQCYPSGSLISDVDPFPGTVPYYSPGLACPASWTTAGVAVKDASGSVSSNGAFAPFTTGVPSGGFIGDPLQNVIMNALEKQETAVMCCPSDYTFQFDLGACTSKQPRTAYSASTACNYYYNYPLKLSTETLDFFGKTRTVEIPLDPTGSVSLHRSAITFNGTTGTAVAIMNAVTLVHAATTAMGSPTGTSTSTSSTSTSASSQTRLGSGSSLGVVLACWTVAALTGIALMAPF